MLFAETVENRALANATASRLNAEARVENAKASLLRVSGYSALLICLGLACGATFLGCASIKRAQSSSDEIAAILATAIHSASVRINGEVKLVPGATVALNTKAAVYLDTGASVTIDPNGGVEVEGARSRFDRFANQSQPKSGERVATSYTVLKDVKFGKGAVKTSWTFMTNEGTAPDRQRCYYAERTDRGAAPVVIELAVNGKLVNHTNHLQINVAAAGENCVWFNAQGEG
ncbi:hypothetical protein [Bradyrhizobium genomosp. III]|uniref:hypothetical protein n=1 Tax=Bradyrhizobium genomosp. III TaxID=2683271 RepID=UPI000575F066|nr:hypothetical protein [Bradyrhizobium sp. CCBAU 15635]